MSNYTTQDFLSSVRLRGNIPDTSNDNNLNSDSNILKIASELLHHKLYPLIQSTRGEWYVTEKDYSITANQAGYTIPSRAAGGILRSIRYISGTEICDLQPIEPEHISTTATGTPSAYYIKHNKVILYPTPGTTADTLRLSYYLRPSRLEQTTNCAQVSSFDSGAGTVTVSSIPSTWTTSTDLDFVGANSPFVAMAIDQNATDITSTTLTFASLPDDLAVGDWLAPAGYTPIPQLTYELLHVLAQMTAVKVLEAMGDRDGNNIAWKDLQADLEAALGMLTDRNHAAAKKIVQRNWGFGRRFSR